MTSNSRVRLEVAPGAGELIRTGTTVIFCAEREPGAEVLVDALERGAGDPIELLAAAVVASGFSVPPFAAVDWSNRIQLMVLGGLEVRTDHPALPMLSGAASETWVEHTLRGAAGEVAIEVFGDEVVAGSDLVEGRVPAGGFRINVETHAALVPVDDRMEGAELPSGWTPPRGPSPASVTPDVATPAVSPEPATLETIVAGGEDDDSDPNTSDDLPWLANVDRSSRTATDPDEDEFAAVLAAAVETGAAAHVVAGPVENVDEPEAIRLSAPEPEQQNRAQAKVCSQRHANPPAALTCGSCDEWLPPGAEGIEVVALPALAELVLDDERRLPLDRPYRFGRRPDSDDGHVVGIMTDGAKVSREHVEIRGDGWDITVRDLLSTNGTFIAPPGGDPEPLQPDETRRVEIGTIVVFGTRHLEIAEAESPDTRTG